MLDQLKRSLRAPAIQLLELAFGWLLAKPVIGSVIAGATTPEQIEQNVAAGGQASLARRHRRNRRRSPA